MHPQYKDRIASEAVMLGPEVLKGIPATARSDETLWRLEADGRVSVRLEVSIYCHGYLLCRRLATELSASGLFVETSPLKVGRRAYLEVEFVIDFDDETRLYRLPAYVCAERPDGLELEFVDLKQAQFRSIA
jgi:hypothetical protein